MRFIFGLDVLERQADELKALEATGVPIESVLRADASKVDFRAVKLEYLPQVAERRSRGIQHQVNVRLPINFFSEVEKWSVAVRKLVARRWLRVSLNRRGFRH